MSKSAAGVLASLASGAAWASNYDAFTPTAHLAEGWFNASFGETFLGVGLAYTVVMVLAGRGRKRKKPRKFWHPIFFHLVLIATIALAPHLFSTAFTATL